MSLIRARVGEVFEIRLKSYGGTGYAWEPVYETTELFFYGRKVVSPESGGIGGGECIYRFKALRAGDHTITFELKRPWRPHEVAERRQYVVIAVQ